MATTGWGIPLVLGPLVTARFPGDPGSGNFYFGGKPDTLTSESPPGFSGRQNAFATWESRMDPWSSGRKMGIARIYLDGSSTDGWSGSESSFIALDIANGRLPHISFKYPTQWGSLEAGMNIAYAFGSQWDSWMDALAQKFISYAPTPIWWTFFHEPEDHSDWTDGPLKYRAIQRRMKTDLAARGVSNATFVQSCTTAPYIYGRGFGPETWNIYYPDWKGTYTPFPGGGASSTMNPNPVDYYLHGDPNSVVDAIGLDVYNFWNAERHVGEDTNYPNGTAAEALSNYTSFQNIWDTIAGVNDFLGKPYVLGEYGVEAYHTGCYVPSGVGTVTGYDGRSLTPPGDAVFAGTNDQRTLTNVTDMMNGLGAKNIVGVSIYNFRLTHDPWRLEYADPNRIRYRGYGTGMTLTNCVLPSLGV